MHITLLVPKLLHVAAGVYFDFDREKNREIATYELHSVSTDDPWDNN